MSPTYLMPSPGYMQRMGKRSAHPNMQIRIEPLRSLPGSATPLPLGSFAPFALGSPAFVQPMIGTPPGSPGMIQPMSPGILLPVSPRRMFPRSRVWRLAFIPLTTAAVTFAYRGFIGIRETHTDIYPGFLVGSADYLLNIVGRCVIWSFQREPCRKIGHEPPVYLTSRTLRNSLDLACNRRGIGWDWGSKLPVPPEMRDVLNRARFLAVTVLQVVLWAVLCDTAHYALQMQGPDTIGSVGGGTIYDMSLPFLLRYLRAVYIYYSAGRGNYQNCLADRVRRPNYRSNWPLPRRPAELATGGRCAMGCFVGKRLLETMARVVAVPHRPQWQRFGTIVGGFSVSAALHLLSFIALGREMDYRPAAFFLMMGVGVLLERLLKQLGSVRRLSKTLFGRMLGWIWASSWTVARGGLLIDPYVQSGVYGGGMSYTDTRRPIALVIRLIQAVVQR
ncbi:hypothetical protein FISHEDRAFT_74010 [Fistulina hepatica ATCC 64428]|uniref:Wax synthase domain-containing protein n=1 Tax=Fistulina hepatica ATCC 64428 TaxID=1128425 RepID=A0A0D7AAR0_9AGAR|nr:hypothetical protein FISHEDRAFT_74010 [Fistulina hepatica ATCC 64428]